MRTKNLKKIENQFIVKSNVITRAVRTSNATIMTMRLFAFGLAKLSDKQYQVKKDCIEFNISLADFAKYYEIGLNQLYDFVKLKGRKMTLIEKEMNILSLVQIKTLYENEPLGFNFTNLFLRCGHRKNTGKVYFKIYIYEVIYI